jgi:hypothetical protein
MYLASCQFPGKGNFRKDKEVLLFLLNFLIGIQWKWISVHKIDREFGIKPFAGIKFYKRHFTLFVQDVTLISDRSISIVEIHCGGILLLGNSVDLFQIEICDQT